MIGHRNSTSDILDRIEIFPADGGCWRFRGTVTTNGYIQVDWRGRKVPAHRLVVELTSGRALPSRMVLDHLCRHRWCVNPDHLEVVTNRVNVRRGLALEFKDRCKSDRHNLSLVGTFIDSEGYERCCECRAESNRRASRRKRERQAA